MDNQQIQDVTNFSLQTAPIFSFLEKKVQRRFSDATRAQVQAKLTMEHAKRREEKVSQKNFKHKQKQTAETTSVELMSQKVINGDFVLYQIKIVKGSSSWVFQTRFSLLSTLSEKLPRDIREQFPEKKFFGNLEPEFLQKRYTKLGKFLKTLFSKGQKLSVFQDFLKQSKMAAVQINDPTSVNDFQLDQ